MDRDWQDITTSEYHAYPAISSGGLKCFEKEGAMDYHAQYIEKSVVSEETTAKRMGTAFHLAMEKPDTWQDSYEILPDVVEDAGLVQICKDIRPEKSKAHIPVMGERLNMKMKLHKKYLDMLEARASGDGKQLMTVAEFAIVVTQICAVWDNKDCREILELKTPTNVEKACIWECPVTGRPVKALVDLTVGGMVVDFKTTMAKSRYDWFRQVEKLGYAFQAAHYLFVTGKTEFRFITVTSQERLQKGCHAEADLWHIPRQKLEIAREQNEKSLYSLSSLLDDLENPTCIKDSQGVPVSFHSEGWGEDLPLDWEEFANKDYGGNDGSRGT
jgi:hypothetical protein